MATGRQCDRCYQVTQPRGGLPPKYCPRCGMQLSGVPFVAVEMAKPESRGPALAAAIACVLAVLAIFFGPLAAVLSIVVALAARGHIALTSGSVGERRIADAALLLSLVAILLHIGVCASF